MKKTVAICAVIFSIIFTGCGAIQPDVPKIKTTKYFNIKDVSLYLTQKVKTDIV